MKRPIVSNKIFLTRINLTAFFLFGARMGLVIDAGQVLKIHMSVDLGGADVGMAEQFLHGA